MQTVRQRAEALELLEELAGKAATWPHAATLAANLKTLLDERRGELSCLLIWREGRTVQVWSVVLYHGVETEALIEAHGNECFEDASCIETLNAAIDERGRRITTRVEGMFHVARITVI